MHVDFSKLRVEIELNSRDAVLLLSLTRLRSPGQVGKEGATGSLRGSDKTHSMLWHRECILLSRI